MSVNNWNGILSNTRNLNDVLIILRKVLAQLSNKFDVTELDEIISKLESTNNLVLDDLGDLKSALNSINEQGGWYKPYLTEVLLLADNPDVSFLVGKALDTKKTFAWERTSAEGATPITGIWHDTGLSELDQAKEFAESNAMFKPVRLTETDDRTLILEAGIYHVTTAEIATSLGLPEPARGQLYCSGKSRLENYIIVQTFITENGSVYQSIYNSNLEAWGEFKGLDGRKTYSVFGSNTYKSVTDKHVTPDLKTNLQEGQWLVGVTNFATIEKDYPLQTTGLLTQSKSAYDYHYQSYNSNFGLAFRSGKLDIATNVVNYDHWRGIEYRKDGMADLNGVAIYAEASSYFNFFTDDLYLAHRNFDAVSGFTKSIEDVNAKPCQTLTATSVGNVTAYGVFYLPLAVHQKLYASFLVKYSNLANIEKTNELTRLRLRRSSDADNIDIYPTSRINLGGGYLLLKYATKVPADRDLLVLSFGAADREIGDKLHLIDGYIGTTEASKFDDRRYLLRQTTLPDTLVGLNNAINAGKISVSKSGQLIDAHSVFDHASFWGSSTIMLMQPFLTTAMQNHHVAHTIERGKGGELVEYTSARFGSYKLIVNPKVAGKPIPESGSILVTSNLHRTRINDILPFLVKINGVQGILEWSSADSDLKFTRSTAGREEPFKDAIAAPIYDQTYRDGILILNVGKNNLTNTTWADLSDPQHVFKETVKMVEHSRSMFKKVLILNNFNNGGTPVISDVRDRVNEYNRLLAEKYGDLVIDSYGYLIGDIFTDTNTIPTTADLEQIALKNLPPSMRIDNGHLNDKANQAIVDHLILPRMRKFGWID